LGVRMKRADTVNSAISGKTVHNFHDEISNIQISFSLLVSVMLRTHLGTSRVLGFHLVSRSRVLIGPLSDHIRGF
jgi:hypothetical protein